MNDPARTTRHGRLPAFDVDAAVLYPALHDALRFLGYLDDAGRAVYTRPSPLELLGQSILVRSPLGVAAAIRLGAPVDVQCFTDFTHGLSALTAVGFAALCDSADGQVLLTPLVLSLGGRIDEIDSEGRRVTDFARFEPLHDLLVLLGAAPAGQGIPRAPAGLTSTPLPPGTSARTFPPSMPIPQADMAATVRPWLVEVLDELGFGKRGGPVALLYPQQEISHALDERDHAAIHRLIELGALEGHGGFHFSGEDRRLDGLNAWTLATALDCEEGTTELTALLLDSGHFPTPDLHGRSMLHVATHPAVCHFLLERGLDPAAQDHEGRLPAEVLPAVARAVLERNVLGHVPSSRQGVSAGAVVRRL